MDEQESVELTEEQQKQIDDDLNFVSRHAHKNDKLAWRRKEQRMEELLKKLKPFEDRILEIILEKQPICDKISELRETMFRECVHPKKHLVHKGDHVQCKFCLKHIYLNQEDYDASEEA